MKKEYMSPKTQIVSVNLEMHLLTPSVAGTNMGDGFTSPIVVGGSTDSADSRGGGFWDDEDW